MGYYDKAGSSTINVMQALAWTGSGTTFSTNFASQTRQIRVISQVAGWISVTQTTGVTVPTTAGGAGVFIAANTASGDYFSCNPGQIFSFASTSTSSGSVSVTEMS